MSDHTDFQRGARVQAVGLVDRLLVLDARIHVLEAEKAELKQRLIASASHQPGNRQAFDVPRTKHEWKLAEDEACATDALGQYDVRVDDPVVLEGRCGAAFMARFGLLGATPNFVGAVRALNQLCPQQSGAPPEVSIVIPVHGALAYTLNALDSLLRHASRHVFEIILVDDASPDASPQFLPQIVALRYHAMGRNTGFITASNVGAALARGAYIVMLNNDTRVVAGWLDALLASFSRWPQAGLVGAKLLYPDGSLQEAGGIVWRDGSATNDGRGDDPNRPQYAYARQVDYVSGCAIALPSALWRELGGFDEHFSPAYCEDVDLALRVRAAGWQVWFQPQARVVHYEGTTSGTDLASGTKAWQTMNTKKLYLRWREQLSHHPRRGQAVYFERERGVHQRILVVDVSTPTPDQDAGSVQTVLALQSCMALGYKTHFVAQDNALFQPCYTTELQEMGVECAYAPYEPAFEAYMHRYGWLFDVVLVFRPSVMEKCLPAIRSHAPQAAVLFHVADLHHLRMARTADLENDVDLRHAAEIMRGRELALVRQVDCTITHSSVEREILAQAVPGAPMALWPLMQVHVGTRVPFAARRDVCFIGGYRHPPNIDAVCYFVAEIFPLLRASEPGIRFIIAGSFVPEEVQALAAPDIIIAGQVAELGSLFDACRVFVCPLRVGAGVKGKIISAMAHGLPVVATPMGVEGAGLEPEQDVLVGEMPQAFAAQVLRLYREPELWQRLSGNSQDRVRDAHSPQMGERALAQAIDTALAYRLGLPG